MIGQLANAFACRSAVAPPWRLGWASNHLLVGAVAIEAVLIALTFLVAPVADLLGQAPPPMAGWAVAACAAPAVFGADALHKALRRRRDVPESAIISAWSPTAAPGSWRPPAA
ncbi:MAG: cation transporting ATPase C-terminal domain-containing protein [Gaiellales bacterium]